MAKNAENLDGVLEFYKKNFRAVARYKIVMKYRWKEMGVFIDGLEFEDAYIEASRLHYEFRDDGNDDTWGNMLFTPVIENKEEALAHLRSKTKQFHANSSNQLAINS